MKYMLLLAFVACKIDPNTLQPCGDHCHVLPETSVDEGVRSHLTETSPTLLCVPDRNIAAGRYIPLPCPSLYNAEGRCLGACIPEVGAVAALLPSGAPCSPGEVCAPCTNPFTGASTGACEIGDDHE